MDDPSVPSNVRTCDGRVDDAHLICRTSHVPMSLAMHECKSFQFLDIVASRFVGDKIFTWTARAVRESNLFDDAMGKFQRTWLL